MTNRYINQENMRKIFDVILVSIATFSVSFLIYVFSTRDAFEKEKIEEPKNTIIINHIHIIENACKK